MHYKSVFISDFHLGTKKAKAKKLLKFLDTFTCDNLFLVGDIIDGWALSLKYYWPKNHKQVLAKIYKISKTAKVFYITGNHDDFLRTEALKQFPSVEIKNDHVYTSILGEKIYIVHGDLWDKKYKLSNNAIRIVSYTMDTLHLHNIVEKAFNTEYFKVTHVEKNLKEYVEQREFDKVICGHTHVPKIQAKYMNCGDWVKSCTAIIETLDGQWKLLKQ